MERKTSRLHIADMPADIHAQAKLSAYSQNMTLKDWTILAMAEKLEREREAQK